jgi:hypothetical protein
MSRTTLRPALAAVSLIVALVAAVVVPAASASASAYRYWGYFQLQGSSWAFATKGPDQVTPADGSVEGWRFAVGGEGDSRMPRAAATFADLCGSTAAESGKKRVGVVIDYGRAADTEDGAEPPAPTGKCAVVATAATGAEVLAAVASVRAEQGLVCAVDRHPATGCGGEVKEVSAQAQAADTPVTLATATPSTAAGQAAPASAAAEESGSNLLAFAGIAALIGGATALVLVGLRRRGSD